jgi:hypothetical protein
MTDIPNATRLPRIRAAYPLRPNDEYSRRRNEALDVLQEGVRDHVRDLGRVAVWTILKLDEHSIKPNTTVEVVRAERGDTAHIKDRSVIGVGWLFWQNQNINRAWCLMRDATMQLYSPQDGRALVVNRDPNVHRIDFDSGVIKENVDRPSVGGYMTDNSDAAGLLGIFGIDYQPTAPTGLVLLPALYPELADLVAQYQAAEGWRNAFDEFLLGKQLPRLPIDL